MNFRKHFPVFWRIFPALRDILPGLWQEYQQVQKKHRQIGAILSAEVLGKVRILYENQPPVRAGGCRRPLIGRHCLYAVLGLSQKGAKSAAIFLTVLPVSYTHLTTPDPTTPCPITATYIMFMTIPFFPTTIRLPAGGQSFLFRPSGPPSVMRAIRSTPGSS